VFPLQRVIGEYGLYNYNVTIVKQLGDCVKVSHCRSIRKKGLEVEKPEAVAEPKENQSDYAKLEASISRAKRMVKEYALCNEWDFFATFTIDSQKFGRYDLRSYHKAFGELIHNYNRRRDEVDKVRFVLIPELHKDGAWHMHGLIKGISKRDLVKNKNGYWDWRQYSEKFGFMSLSLVKDKKRLASYITKYINKSVAATITEYGARLYYCSKGLKTGTVIYQGSDPVTVLSGWDYERPDGYCKIKWYDSVRDYVADVRFGYDETPGAVLDDQGAFQPDSAAFALEEGREVTNGKKESQR
jgi:hypothetical protein